MLWNADLLGRADLPGHPETVHAHCFQAPPVGNARLVYTVYDLSFWTHSEFTTEANRLACQQGLLDAIHSAAGLVLISESSRRDFFSTLSGVGRAERISDGRCVAGIPVPLHRPGSFDVYSRALAERRGIGTKEEF